MLENSPSFLLANERAIASCTSINRESPFATCNFTRCLFEVPLLKLVIALSKK